MEPEQLQSLRRFVDPSMLMLIWLVQLVIYPAFSAIDAGRFRQWHHRYMRTVSILVIPLMIAQTLLITMQCINDPEGLRWIAATALLAALGATFALSVPCHKQLQKHGNRTDLSRRLVATNWIRTFAWTVVWLSGL